MVPAKRIGWRLSADPHCPIALIGRLPCVHGPNHSARLVNINLHYAVHCNQSVENLRGLVRDGLVRVHLLTAHETNGFTSDVAQIRLCYGCIQLRSLA